MKRLHSWMIGTHLFVGIGAVTGGIAPILNPSTPLSTSTEMLKKGPFSNYLIPGLFLLVVLGAGNLISVLLIFKKFRFRGFWRQSYYMSRIVSRIKQFHSPDDIVDNHIDARVIVKIRMNGVIKYEQDKTTHNSSNFFGDCYRMYIDIVPWAG